MNAYQFGHLMIAALIAVPLVYAAAAKVMSPRSFSDALPRLRLPLPSATGTAFIVAIAELTLAGLILVIARWESAVAGALAFIAFAWLLERAMRAGATGDCGCFGALPGKIGRAAVIRNIVLAIGALALAGARSLAVLPVYPTHLGIPLLVGLFIGAAVLDTLVEVRQSAKRGRA
ncbi:MAG: MauE/DoxX family redox-associated membrane protein [Candidatus Limnocylindria bacterium]